MKILNNRGYTPQPLLTKSTITDNNLTLSLEEDEVITIQTGGEWKGTITELAQLIKVVVEDLTDAN